MIESALVSFMSCVTMKPPCTGADSLLLVATRGRVAMPGVLAPYSTWDTAAVLSSTPCSSAQAVKARVQAVPDTSSSWIDSVMSSPSVCIR